MSKKLLIILLSVVLILVGLGFYYFKFVAGIVSVDKTEMVNRKIIKTVSASGKIKSENEANLSFRASGKINKILFEKGDKVNQNDVIATLDKTSTVSSIKSYKDALDIKLRDRDLFLQQYQDDKGALGGDREFDISLRRLNEQISQAEATYKAQSYQVNDYEIRSPINGILLDVVKKEGEVASINEIIAKVANPDTVIFETDIDQEDFGQIALNLPAKINLDPYDGKEFTGTITKLPLFANLAGENIDQFTIEITMDKATDPILIGMKGDTDISVKQSETEVPSLLFDEIFDEADKENYDIKKKYVWILDNNILKKEYIETGLEGDIYSEIKSDLTGKTIVVPINKTDKLEDGKKAKISNKNGN